MQNFSSPNDVINALEDSMGLDLKGVEKLG